MESSEDANFAFVIPFARTARESTPRGCERKRHGARPALNQYRYAKEEGQGKEIVR